MIYAQVTQPGVHRQRGLSLVELMVAITIGIILLAGVLQIYLSSKQSYRVQEATSRLQENGRFAIELLGRDIRDAGNFGCRARTVATDNTVTPGPGEIIIIDHVNGGSIAAQAVTGTERGGNVPDSIAVLTTNASFAVSVATPTKASDITVALPNTLAVNDVVLAADCRNGDVFRIAGVTPAGANTLVDPLPVSLSSPYRVGTRLFTLRAVSYTIAAGASGQNALFQSVNGAAAEELVEGVENMQILYGVDGPDADFSAEQYLTAAGVVAAGATFKVVSVQISLLLVSAGDTGANVVTAPQTYTFPLGAASATTAADRRLRRVFTSTFSVRNRTS